MDTILIEKQLSEHPRVKRILSYFPKASVELIEDYLSIFQKKHSWADKGNTPLILAEKKGSLLKEAPELYAGNGLHYVLQHSYNCLFDCTYCYLQGSFRDPSMVVFVNYEEMWEEILRVSELNNNSDMWIYTGDNSDSLALDHVFGLSEFFIPRIASMNNLRMELRTKSSQHTHLLSLPGTKQVEIAYSMNPEFVWKTYEKGTAHPSKRLEAMKKLYDHGYSVGLRLDPVIYYEGFEKEYDEFLKHVFSELPDIASMSLGTFRMPANVAKAIKERHPHSPLLTEELVSGDKGFVHYFRPLRKQVYSTIMSMVQKYYKEDRCYVCMDTY